MGDPIEGPGDRREGVSSNFTHLEGSGAGHVDRDATVDVVPATGAVDVGQADLGAAQAATEPAQGRSEAALGVIPEFLGERQTAGMEFELHLGLLEG